MKRIFFALSCFASLSAQASAAVLTVSFTGVVTSVTQLGTGNTAYPFNSPAGTIVSGTVTANSLSFPCSITLFSASCSFNGTTLSSSDVSATIQFGTGAVISFATPVNAYTIPQGDFMPIVVTVPSPQLGFADGFSKGEGQGDGFTFYENALLNSAAEPQGKLQLGVGAQHSFIPNLTNNLTGMFPFTFHGASTSMSSYSQADDFSFGLPNGASIFFTVTSVVPGVAGPPSPPFGSFDSPVSNTSNVTGAIPVTGWALDNAGVTSLELYRDPVSGETPGKFGFIFLGNASFVAGARPDVQAAYPALPNANAAGWGYQLLTNFLPNNGGAAGPGNGTYRLHAIAYDAAGLTTELGAPGKTFTATNASATLPFGTLDTPAQGGSVSGTVYTNFGWALTPGANFMIPTNGSTINVMIDGQTLGHPVYNQFRSDIATLFPGYTNSSGAVGYYTFDTTKFANAVHTIDWIVTDNGGRAQGIGSRYFTVANGIATASVPQTVSAEGKSSYPYRVEVEESGHIELPLRATSGYQLVNGQREALPVGSSIRDGVFYWLLGPGFLGNYELMVTGPGGEQIPVYVRVRPKTFRRSPAQLN